MTVTEVAPALPRAALERELKFALPEARAGIAGRMLDALCRPDPQFIAAVVSTIYYDTSHLRLLREKLDSDFLKTKVRLRWYGALAGDAGRGCAFLEVKTRLGALRRKARVETPLTAEWLAHAELHDPALERVVERARSLGVELPTRLVPAMLIRYERYRYLEPVSGARVSLDRRLEAPRANPVLLRHSGPVRLGTAVVEVKGGGDELPRALLPLTHLGARRAAFSKYAEAGLALLRFRL
jgi:VTC domain